MRKTLPALASAWDMPPNQDQLAADLDDFLKDYPVCIPGYPVTRLPTHIVPPYIQSPASKTSKHV